MKVIPREVKKVITNSKMLRELRSVLKLSKLQKKVLFGTLLGDGCLVANSWGKNYRLQIEHSELQKNYVFWKYKIFKNFVITPPQFHIRTRSWRFRTISSKEFTGFREIFYHHRRKVLPYDLTLLRDPLVLAIWFMDDGGELASKDYGVHGYLLNIQNFTSREVNLIKQFFLKQLKIPVTLQRNKQGYRLYIQKVGVPAFRELVGDYLLKEFKYKLS